MITVEPYSEKYRDDIFELFRLLHEDHLYEYLGLFDRNWALDKINEEGLKTSADNSFLMIINGRCEGVVYGVIYDCKVNNGLIFQETMLYVKREFRRYSIMFFKEIEKRLKARSISFIIMTVLENSQADELTMLYKRLGYRSLERHLIRRL